MKQLLAKPWPPSPVDGGASQLLLWGNGEWGQPESVSKIEPLFVPGERHWRLRLCDEYAAAERERYGDRR